LVFYGGYILDCHSGIITRKEILIANLIIRVTQSKDKKIFLANIHNTSREISAAVNTRYNGYLPLVPRAQESVLKPTLNANHGRLTPG